MKIILSGLLALAFIVPAPPTMAENAEHVAQLKRTKKCPNCDLSGANLFLENLSDANLSGANLNRAGLYRANLSGANLSGASLKRSSLSGANLSGVNLSGASLRRASLAGANLSGAKFCRTTMPDGKVRNDGC